jgi:metal-responsive CopG/Arc/MetJ family transcriptional regulator
MTAKKVIQVPVDEELLNSLNKLSKKQRKARSEVIRQACLRYLEQADVEEQNKIYREGYIRIPEEPNAGKAQAALLAERLREETW